MRYEQSNTKIGISIRLVILALMLAFIRRSIVSLDIGSGNNLDRTLY